MLTIGSADIVCVLRDVTFEHSSTLEDVRGACRFGQYRQETKRQGTLSVNTYGTGTAAPRTSHLDMSALNYGGVDLRDYTYTLSLSGSFDKAALPGNGVRGVAEGITGKNWAGSLELQPAAGTGGNPGAVQALQVASASTVHADREKEFELVLNGNPFKFMTYLEGFTFNSSEAQFQRVTIPFGSQTPAAPGLNPTLPASIPGSPSLLDYAIHSPKTNLPFTFASHTTEGVVSTGFLTWDTWSFEIAENVVLYTLSWRTFGNYTVTAN